MSQLEKREHRELKFAAPVLVAAVVGIVVWVSAGDLNPPAGPVTPTMKTLTEVEPRTPVESLSGDADALYVINEPGSYYLTGNITGVSGKHGIEITTNGVTLDLNGFAMIGVSGSESAVLALYSSANLVVRNGTVDNWASPAFGAAVYVVALNGRVEGLHVSNNGCTGIFVWGCTVAACSAHNNGCQGILAQNCTIVNCVAEGNGKGIETSSSTVTKCTANNNGSRGFDGHRSTFAHCTAVYNGDKGFALTVGTMANCTSASNTGDGIFAGVCHLVGNTCKYNTGDGIEIVDSCYVVGNACDNNGAAAGDGAGIYATGASNRIEGNNVSWNDRGIDVDGTNNIIIKNSAAYNSGGAQNYDIVTGNSYGPIVNVAGVGDISGTTNANHPWANFSY